MSYESPNYRVTDRLGKVEVRDYDGYLVAQTQVKGSLETAGNEGFRVLAAYIFGKNEGEKKIDMTAPVSQSGDTGAKIDMTAPVAQQQNDGRYTITFMMPSEYSAKTLPVPVDPRVEIVEMPPRTLAAIRYSGRWTKKNYDTHLARLRWALREAGFEPVGEPVWARYNSPFTPWFLRRNEILTSFAPRAEEP